MPTYFKPLRRKIGLVTLVVACLFAGAWIRSLFATDWLEYLISERASQRIILSGAGLSSETIHYAKSTTVVTPIRYQALKPDSRNPLKDKLWSRSILGFEFGELRPPMEGMSIDVCVIHFWTITTPFIMLSAWLLLSKPRARKSP